MLKPLRDRVLVRKLKKEQLGKIVLPESVQDDWNRGEVVAIGEGIKTDNGTISMSVKVGDIVLFPSKSMGMAIPTVGVGEEEMMLITESMIFAIEEV